MGDRVELDEPLHPGGQHGHREENTAEQIALAPVPEPSSMMLAGRSDQRIIVYKLKS